MRGNYPDGVTRADLLDAIEAFDAGIAHEFAASTDFDILLPDGRRYPPKAITGIAARRVVGRLLRPQEFSSGLSSKCFRVLHENGFEIVAKEDADETIGRSDEWTDSELRAAVAAYKEMLAFEKVDQPYSKADYNTSLRASALQNRSKGSVEYRMQNISATLHERGLPWIQGYKPHHNVGEGVKRRILHFIAELSPEYRVFEPSTDDAEVRRKVHSIVGKKTLTKPFGIDQPETVGKFVLAYQRSPAIAAFVLQEAQGVCELCQVPAPFLTDDDTPFLEVHHVVPLSQGGADAVENAAALCPNCHRRLHHSKDRREALSTLRTQVPRIRVQTDGAAVQN